MAPSHGSLTIHVENCVPPADVREIRGASLRTNHEDIITSTTGFLFAAITPAREMPLAARASELTIPYLMTHRPDAVLAKVNKSALKFTAGALAGALGKTATAPFDRLKLLMQVKGGLEVRSPRAMTPAIQQK